MFVRLHRLTPRLRLGVKLRGRLIPAGTGMPAYREIFLEKDEPPVVQPSLEDLLRPETEEDEALSLADFDDEQ
jgi:hypothetical protein